MCSCYTLILGVIDLKKSSLIVVTIVICLILGIVGTFFGFVIHDLKIESKLEEEWIKLGYDEKIDMQIYSSGDYAKVERQVKLNFQTLYQKIDALFELFENDAYLGLLTNQNYQKDGPNFEKSFILVEKTTTKATSLINEIENMKTNAFVRGERNKIKADDYYKDYYVDVLENKTIYFESIEDAISGYQEMTKITEKVIQVLLFLRENQDQWYIEDNVFIYASEEFYQSYLTLVNGIEEDYDAIDKDNNIPQL